MRKHGHFHRFRELDIDQACALEDGPNLVLSETVLMGDYVLVLLNEITLPLAVWILEEVCHEE